MGTFQTVGKVKNLPIRVEWHGVKVTISASHSGGPGFQSRQRHMKKRLRGEKRWLRDLIHKFIFSFFSLTWTGRTVVRISFRSYFLEEYFGCLFLNFFPATATFHSTFQKVMFSSRYRWIYWEETEKNWSFRLSVKLCHLVHSTILIISDSL